MASLLPNGKQQYFTSAGVPLVGGKLYTYAANTLTPKATYTNAAATVSNTNPVILDSRGEAVIFWSGSYDIVLKDSLDNVIYSAEDISNEVDISTIMWGGVALSTILQTSSVHVVETITALKAVDSTKYAMALVQGYYAAGDGGGGLYWHDSGDTTTSDNSGTVIVATDTARWKLLTYGKPISVLQFGAKSDYTTDATTAFQAAIDYVYGLGGGIVSAAGSYLLSTGFTVKAGVTVLGEAGSPAQSATGTYTPATTASMLIMPSGQTITMNQGGRIEGFTILESDLAPGATYALPLTSVNAAAAVANFAGTAISAGAGVYDIEIVNCMILGFQYGFDNTAGTGNKSCMLEKVFIDCTNGTVIEGQQTDVAYFTDVRCEPYLTAHLADSTKDARTGIAFTDYTLRPTYSNCRAREFSVGFFSENSSAHHLACSVYNYAATNSKIGFKYTYGGLAVYNTDCTAWNCGSGCVYSNLPAVSTELRGITIQGADFYNASPCASADGLVYIVDGFYTITDSQFGNNVGYGFIKIGADADYGSVDNITVYQTTGLQPIFGDATALLKLRLGTIIYTDTTSVKVQPLTWTPVIKINTTAQTATCYGHYTITNQHCTAYFDITMSAESGTGNVTITGLPYTAANETDSMLGMGLVAFSANMNGLTREITASVAKNTAIIDLWQGSATGQTALTHTETTATTRLVGWVTYRIVQ